MPNNETIEWKESTPELDATNEQAVNEQTTTDRQLGSKILSSVGFENKKIVESSFNKARKRGEKLPGKNNERRNYAYLSRLENLIDKYGNDMEKKLWQASLDKVHIIQPEDFTDNYWKYIEQGLRDNGHGHTLEEWEKEAEIKNCQDLQRSTLKNWANYLGDETSPYPMWFKLYAWDGVTKMGGYDKEKHSYKKRDRHTTAPYPDCNPEIISSVYGYVNNFYNTPDHALYNENGTRDKELEALVASGNFARLYSLAEKEISPIVPTPENPEDIHGEWVAYTIGDEKAMAIASRGTGWCTVNPSVARSYLKSTTYGQIEYDEEYDENDVNQDSKATFWVFHLYDPSSYDPNNPGHPGKLAKNGCLAILLDSNGNVTNEVRGLGEGEAVEDSLLPTLEQKLETLPGNETKMAELLDSKTLMTLDRKMQKGEDLTKEELEFIYEINRPIKTLDTYNNYDPRINELKEKYDIKYTLDAGVDADKLISHLDPDDIADNLDTLLSHDANIDNIVSHLYSYNIADNLDTLLSHGADIDNVVSHLDSDDIVKNLDTLLSHGVKIDIDDLVSHLHSYCIAENLDTLLSHGIKIDIDDLVSRLDPYYIVKNLDTLIHHGANIDVEDLLPHLRSYDIVKNLDTFLSHGADIDNVVSHLHSYDIAKNLDSLISHGANINDLVSNLSLVGASKDLLDALISHGANIDDIIFSLSSTDTVKNLDVLIFHGANIDDLVSNLFPADIIKNLGTLIRHGVEIDTLVSNLSSADIVKNLDTLIHHGANIDIDNLVSRLNSRNIAENLDTLLSHGANIDNIISRLDPYQIAENLDILLSHGVKIDIDDLVSHLDPDDIAENLDTLRRHGYTGVTVVKPL